MLRARRLIQRDALYAAWVGANLVARGFHNPETMPGFDEISGEKRKPRRQSPEGLRAAAMMIVAATGGRIIER